MTSTLSNTRVQFDMAVSLNQNIDNRLKLETAKSMLMMELYTSTLHLVGKKKQSADELKSDAPNNDINFFGRKFVFNDVETVIQDQSGLVSLQPFNDKLFSSFLALHEVDDKTRMQIVDQLQDWLDKDNFTRIRGAEKGDYPQPFLPTNNDFQTLHELFLVPSVSPEIYNSIKNDLSVYSGFDLVSNFMPVHLLPLQLSDDETKTLIETRQLTGPSDNEMNGEEEVYPSGYFNIELKSVVNGQNALSFSIIRGLGTQKPFYIINENYN